MRLERDADLAWVGSLSGGTARGAARAIAEAGRETSLLERISAEHRREGRDSYVEIDAPFELYAIARLLRPGHILEIGVSSGVSSAYLLAALDRNRKGTLHSVDLPSFERRKSSGRVPKASWSLPPGRAPGWAIPTELRGRWDLRLGDMADVVPVLARELDDVGMVVYDVPHDEAEIGRELASLDPHLAPGCVVIVDHGPGGGTCQAVRRWGRRHGSPTWRRQGLGLSGARKAGRNPAS